MSRRTKIGTAPFSMTTLVWSLVPLAMLVNAHADSNCRAGLSSRCKNSTNFGTTPASITFWMGGLRSENVNVTRITLGWGGFGVGCIRLGTCHGSIKSEVGTVSLEDTRAISMKRVYTHSRQAERTNSTVIVLQLGTAVRTCNIPGTWHCQVRQLIFCKQTQAAIYKYDTTSKYSTLLPPQCMHSLRVPSPTE